MRIHKCWFCSSPIYPGHGVIFVRNDAKEFRFCRGKCHKAFKKRRNPRKVKWTKVYRKANQKELSDDLALTFERKRNALQKYDRETLLTTIESIQKIDAIKTKRESAFIKKRLKKGLEDRKAEDKKLVDTSMHLIRASNARDYVAKKRKMEMSDDSAESEVDLDQTTADVEMVEVEKASATTPKEKKRAEKRRRLLASY